MRAVNVPGITKFPTVDVPVALMLPIVTAPVTTKDPVIFKLEIVDTELVLLVDIALVPLITIFPNDAAPVTLRFPIVDVFEVADIAPDPTTKVFIVAVLVKFKFAIVDVPCVTEIACVPNIVSPLLIFKLDIVAVFTSTNKLPMVALL